MTGTAAANAASKRMRLAQLVGEQGSAENGQLGLAAAAVRGVWGSAAVITRLDSPASGATQPPEY
jgi:hypothetical protein